MKGRFFFVLFLLLTFHQNIEAQNKGESQKANNIQRIKSSETLFYYGADFSHVRIYDGSKVSRSDKYSDVYPSAWIAYLEKDLVHNGYIQGALKKKDFYYIPEEIYDISIRVAPEFIIGHPYSFPLDTIKSAIKNYNIHKSSGIGLVLIPESFNKEQESAKVWIVFFDLQNREILWATKVTGTCKHMGYTAHWGSGVIDAFKIFIKNRY